MLLDKEADSSLMQSLLSLFFLSNKESYEGEEQLVGVSQTAILSASMFMNGRFILLVRIFSHLEFDQKCV